MNNNINDSGNKRHNEAQVALCAITAYVDQCYAEDIANLTALQHNTSTIQSVKKPISFTRIHHHRVLCPHDQNKTPHHQPIPKPLIVTHPLHPLPAFHRSPPTMPPTGPVKLPAKICKHLLLIIVILKLSLPAPSLPPLTPSPKRESQLHVEAVVEFRSPLRPMATMVSLT